MKTLDEMAEKYADIEWSRLCGSYPNIRWVSHRDAFKAGYLARDGEITQATRREQESKSLDHSDDSAEP